MTERCNPNADLLFLQKAISFLNENKILELGVDKSDNGNYQSVVEQFPWRIILTPNNITEIITNLKNIFGKKTNDILASSRYELVQKNNIVKLHIFRNEDTTIMKKFEDQIKKYKVLYKSNVTVCYICYSSNAILDYDEDDGFNVYCNDCNKSSTQ